MPNEVTKKTHTLVQPWSHAGQKIKRLRQELNRAECEFANAQNELGKWLIPEGFKDKTFHIWFGSGILAATEIGGNSYKVEWLKEPDGKDRHEWGF